MEDGLHLFFTEILVSMVEEAHGDRCIGAKECEQ